MGESSLRSYEATVFVRAIPESRRIEAYVNEGIITFQSRPGTARVVVAPGEKVIFTQGSDTVYREPIGPADEFAVTTL
jgi:hypothetical protein